MIYDQHVHTKYSQDSHVEIEEYLKIAQDKNIKYFISCDHNDFDLPHYKVDWLVNYQKYDQEIQELQKKYRDITFLKGIELGYRKDKLEEMKKILNNRQFDLINLSVHDDGYHDYYDINIFKNEGVDHVMNIYLDNIIDALITFDDFDVLSHIDYGFKTLKLVYPNADFFRYQDKISKIMKLIIKKNKVMEINVKVQQSINDERHLRNLLQLYKKIGGTKLSLSSDAHSIDMYYKDFDKYMRIIKEEGFNNLSYFINRKEYLYHLS